MCELLVEGGERLCGERTIQGSKNSVLPILAATLVCADTCVIENCPKLRDVDASVAILRHLGCCTHWEDSALVVDTARMDRAVVPDALMREMRSSVIFLGAILARCKEATICYPGGCELGPRPIDLHLKALRQMGMVINEFHGYLDCSVPARLKGTSIALSFPSVGATENIILAAALAEGTTVVNNAAREPEICDLCGFLNACGARISGAGEGRIVIEGVEKLTGTEHHVIPDRIAATTFMTAAAVTGGDLLLRRVVPDHLSQVIPMFQEAGCRLRWDDANLRIQAPQRLRAVKSVRTMPYPGFPTDAQAPMMAMTTVSDGISIFVENIFESRYKHVGELCRLGANIKVEGRVAIVEGVPRLFGASVEAPDLRGGAALIVAGLAADGLTEVSGLRHVDRGYEAIEKSLNQIGAKVSRI